jgi:hypothetical protein
MDTMGCQYVKMSILKQALNRCFEKQTKLVLLSRRVGILCLDIMLLCFNGLGDLGFKVFVYVYDI